MTDWPCTRALNQRSGNLRPDSGQVWHEVDWQADYLLTTTRDSHYDKLARELSETMSPGPRWTVIGSTSFWGDDSRQICIAAGEVLADLEESLGDCIVN